MNNHEYIERYVYAVTKLLPKKGREEVANEIRASIDEMLEARCGEITPTDKDVRVVLAELGTPVELAQKYDTDPVDHLIGGIYYTRYKMVVKTVLIAVACGITLACVLGFSLDQDVTFWEGVIDWWSAFQGSIVSAFALITIIFAIFERKQVKIGDSSTDDLPSVPKKDEKIGLADGIIGIALAIFFTVLVLGFGDVIPVMFNINDDSCSVATIPLFNIDVVRAAWLPCIMLALSDIVREAVRIIEGRYNLKVLITTAVTTVTGIVSASLFFLGKDIFNTAGMIEATELVTGTELVIPDAAANLGNFVFWIIVICTVADLIKCLIKYLRNSEKNK